MTNGSNGKLPGSDSSQQVWAVGLTREEIDELLAFLDACMADTNVRKAYTSCYRSAKISSAMTVLRWRRDGRG